MNLKQLQKRVNLTAAQCDGSQPIDGGLDLDDLTSLPEGFNPTVSDGLYLRGLTTLPEGFSPRVGGGLDLSGLTTLPEGFNPRVGGSLYLNGLTSIPEGFNPRVGGGLQLRGLTSLPDGFSPTVSGGLYLNGLTSIPEGFNPRVGGSLDLSGLTSLPEGFGPTVGDYLDLSGLTSIPEGFNPRVGGSLDLRGLTTLPEGFNPRVGGSLDLSGLTSLPEGVTDKVLGATYTAHGPQPSTAPTPYILSGCYVLADGLLREVIERKGNMFIVRRLHLDEVSYLAIKGKLCAHGRTRAEALADLKFKAFALKAKITPIHPHTVVTTDLYRATTGACCSGIDEWCEHYNVTDGITVAELLPILRKTNAYGLERFEALVTA